MFRIAFILLSCCAVFSSGKVCQSMEIRNRVVNLGNLKNCTEIVGSLKILLMERVQHESEFDEYVFPELTKISGYLMFFDVYHLPSVAKLFPNLRVIRGMELYADYALVLHNMPHLREIGTDKLMFIARGLVKVDKCPHICFVNTIDWKRIGAARIHFNNLNNGTCDACSANCKGYCWNSTSCQITDTENCHIECLGCSRPNSADHCYACKNYDDNGTCVDKCPPNKYVHNYANKCVTKEECHTMVKKLHWWTHDGHCVSECPQFYQEISFIDQKGINQTMCRLCGDKCVRLCRGDTIDNMAKLQEFRGCTHVYGSLAVKIKSLDPTSLPMNLEEYLGSIKYIDGSLTVGRTNDLGSLDFLKNLRYIGGNDVNNTYTIFMYENHNLQKLWNFDDPKFQLKIGKGKIRFHNNPLLCTIEIEKLSNITGVEYSKLEVSPYSNGDKTTCFPQKMNVTVHPWSTNATLMWDEKALNKCDNYVGFTIYFKVHKLGEASFTDSKDVCVRNEWKSIFTTNTSFVLSNLEADSRYAFYIKIYCVSKDTFQSTMMYFVTLPDDPDIPENVVLEAIDHTTIQLRWRPPLHINGVLAYYKIDFNEQPDEAVDRNYCEQPRTIEGEKTDTDSNSQDIMHKPENKTTKKEPVEDDCECVEPLKFDDISIQTIDQRFELCDLFAQSKFQRDDCKHFLYQPVSGDMPKLQKRDDNNNTYSSFNKQLIIGANDTAYNITNLKHFTLYIFYFSACNHPKEKHKCSSVLMYSMRTMKKIDADDVEEVNVEVIDNTDVKLTWKEPSNPNSRVVAYRIKYNKVDAGHSHLYKECLSKDGKFNGTELILKNLTPGKYSLTVQAESLAGIGRYSETKYFTIEAPSADISIMVTTILVSLFILSGSVAIYLWYRRKRKLERMHLITSINPDYDGAIYVEDEWELERDDIDIQTNLGQGTFGTVYYGVIKSRNAPCAVKTINKSLTLHEHMEFLNEASVMKSFSNCHHVVKLIGVVSKGQPPLVVMELMDRGDLKKFLRRTRDSSHNLTSNEIYRMSVEIADGMAYLAAKKFVHRDLAARNCMVSGDRTVKIGDFGMARDIYETDYYRKGTKGLLPVRWMAPESLADGVFTSDSDVWSYGIVLWEIATLAEQPYQGLSNEQVLQFTTSRGRLERPAECSDLLYEIMRSCWMWRPNDRPTFWDIVERLENHVGQDFQLLSFIHSREGLEHRIKNGRQRAFNPPAVGIEPQEDLFSHYNVSDDEVSLHVGTVPSRPSFLEATLYPSRESRFSPIDFD
ncbi:insulin-like receptor [Leptinotarsa decemlineata]|uniref:insulin-like receptor n=1 Tax=Leptinotarsa decemlineata TaxID=7539 RepID=UPI003D30B577